MDNHSHHNNLQGKRLIIAIFLNVFVVVAQLGGGLFSNSLSLISDALHNLSDVAALLITLLASRLALRQVTLQKTFGYKRAEIIAALLNAIILVLVAFFLIKEAILRFSDPVEVAGLWVVILACLSIVINGSCVLLLKKDAENSMNIRSAYWHLFADMLTSIGVLVGGAIIMIWHIDWIDSAITLIIATYLFYVSWTLLKQALQVLMHFAPSHIDLQEVGEVILQSDAIKNIHHVHCWQLDDQQIHFEAHLEFSNDLALGEVTLALDQIREQLASQFGIHHTTLQPEIGTEDSKRMVTEQCR